MADNEIVAARIDREISLDATHPHEEWQKAKPVVYSADWQGNNPDAARETQVYVLWSRQMLYLRFECRYQKLFLFGDSDGDGRRDHLWDRDVAEVFLQSDPSRERYYKEFEVSPNGMWVDLDIFPGGRSDLKSGMMRSVVLDEASHRWTAELAIPMRSLVERFDPDKIWRANFFRVEGTEEPRCYMAWCPTYSDQPNFHVPGAFGRLRFAE